MAGILSSFEMLEKLLRGHPELLGQLMYSHVRHAYCVTLLVYESALGEGLTRILVLSLSTSSSFSLVLSAESIRLRRTAASKHFGRAAHVGASSVGLARRVDLDIAFGCAHDADEIALVARLSAPDARARRASCEPSSPTRRASFSCMPQYTVPGRALLRQRRPELVMATQRPSNSSSAAPSSPVATQR